MRFTAVSVLIPMCFVCIIITISAAVFIPVLQLGLYEIVTDHAVCRK